MEGSCDCGAVRFTVELSVPPEQFSPRTCDCEFCSARGAMYVSDPQGGLHIRLPDASALHIDRQGSGQAEFLSCRKCGALVAVRYGDHGAANAQLLDEAGRFAPPASVSPKKLSAKEKVARWRTVWFPRVEIEISA